MDNTDENDVQYILLLQVEKMVFKNYSYDENNYPGFENEDIEKNRSRIVEDSYWNATNLKSIIEKSYDTSRVERLPNRKEEMIFALVALACEQYMKSLAYFDTSKKKLVWGHDLEELFSELSDTIKKKVEELIAEDGFEKKLKDNKDVFYKLRYSYELKGYRIDANFMLKLMNTLSEVCKEYYPDEIIEGNNGFYRCGYAADGDYYGIEIV
ncbi:hypothetical protein [Ruminococcus sp.]|uniref:hypothetical protein n=1 Tax=Ruminococcus sp. TaxID=41978 RepID=UPI0025D91361|nr:hypothetical protein [Ruminococcus sp.]